MSRLLHAAARGARIQYLGTVASLESFTVALVQHDPHNYRIHPDDEHLAYGPISSCVRDEAMQEYRRYGGEYTAPYGSFWLTMVDAHDADRADDLTRSLFLLILAEALADEGM